MPPVRATGSTPAAVTELRAVRLLRLAGTFVFAVVGLLCALLLAIRFVAFPLLESRQSQIAATLSQSLGQPVELDAIATGWDGWNPKVSIRGLRLRDRDPAVLTARLDLPRVDFIVAWTSLPSLDLRLRELIVDGPRLAVSRDARGGLHVGGIDVEPASHGDDSTITEWLLRQPEIVVRNALVTWDDELRGAPQLVLDQVQFRLEHTFDRHRFGLTGTPPAEIAAPVDLRGEIAAAKATDWQRVTGHFYLRLDYADLAAWREWLPLPLPVESGKGALRIWMAMEAGRPVDMTTDLELVDVRTRLAQDLPPLDLDHLVGRVGWKHRGGRDEIFTRALAFVAKDSVALAPTDFKLRHADAEAGRAAEGELSFGRIELAPLTALAAHLPLPPGLRRDLARYAPRGTVRDGKYAWQGPADAPTKFSAHAEFDRLATTAYETVPGAVGISGSLDADESRGTVKLASREVQLDLPRVLADPVDFATMSGSIRFARTGDNLRVAFDEVAFANAHAAGTASGQWRSLPAGPGMLDLKGRLARATFENLYRYIPVKASPKMREWVQRAVQKGVATDVRIAIAGNLADFPFAQGKGQFLVTAKAQGAVLDYAERWPPLTDIEAEVRLDGARIAIDGSAAKMLGATIGRTHVEIADMHDPQLLLKVAGEATGPTREFLAFIQKSPVAEWSGRLTDGAEATGNGRLGLRFDMPLHAMERTKVEADYQFIDNALAVPGMPMLSHANGKLVFSDRATTGTGITAEVLGGPLNLDLAAADGNVRINAAGTVSVAQLRKELDTPLAERASGTADYRVAINARPQAASWTIESSLKGMALDLPAPFGKTAAESVALRIDRRESATRQENSLTVDFGTLGRLQLKRPATPGAPFDRALLLVGKSMERGGEAERPGLWIRANLPALDADAWLAFGRTAMGPSDKSAGKAGAGPVALKVEGVDVEAGTLLAMGRRLTAMKVVARRAGEDWRLNLDGTEAVGTAVWRAPIPIMPNGRVVARLARMTPPPPAEPSAGAGNPVASAPAANVASAWPEIDLATDALISRGHDLGKLEFTARPAGSDWRIEALTLQSDAGSIKANGWWRTAGSGETKLDFTIGAREAGAFLARFGTPDSIRDGPTKITGELSWAGAPSDFDYPSLNGSLRLDTGAGQFLKIDPGVGRLLGVLSLQALPRRATLDFRDVFSEGFAFDTIAGTALIKDGMMSTDNLRMVGPAAAVGISGTVDLERETQALRVKVQPALSTSISAGAAALFIANPLIGAAVGAGALLAQKMFKDPIEQLFSYEYAVSGGWTDPVVERIASRTVAATPGEIAK